MTAADTFGPKSVFLTSIDSIAHAIPMQPELKTDRLYQLARPLACAIQPEGEQMIVTITPAALDAEQAALYVALSKTTVESLVRSGEFPKPRQLSPRRVGFLVAELDAWLASRPVSELLPPPNAGYGRAGAPN